MYINKCMFLTPDIVHSDTAFKLCKINYFYVRNTLCVTISNYQAFHDTVLIVMYSKQRQAKHNNI